MSKKETLAAIVLLLLALLACGSQSIEGPTVRFATATPEQLAEAEKNDVVWYEFKAGDEVPLHVVMIGLAQSEQSAPLRVRAAQTFYIVSFRKTEVMRISLDGETIEEDAVFHTAFAMGADDNGGNSAALVLYVGRRQDMPKELGKE